jgi:pimeloyl-ACP methyl ester carboxylesterase
LISEVLIYLLLAGNPKTILMKKWLLGILFFIVVFIAGYVALYWQNDIPLEVLKKKYCNEQSKFIEVNGQQIHYRDEGNGYPLVLVHGTSSSLHTWDAWVDELKNDFRIIRMDIPAFGITGETKERNYTVENYVKFIDDFTRALGVDTFYLAGNSLGGEITWNYAYTHPERVKKIILIDAAGYKRHNGTPLAFMIAQTPGLNKVMTKITPKRIIRQSMLGIYYDDNKVTDSVVTHYFEMLLRPGNRQAFADRVNVIKYEAEEKANLIKTQTLIQWGQYDTWILPEDAEKFKKDIAGSELKYYAAGHVPMEELPLETAKDAREFLLRN